MSGAASKCSGAMIHGYIIHSAMFANRINTWVEKGRVKHQSGRSVKVDWDDSFPVATFKCS